MLAEVEGEVERKAQEELQQKGEQGDLGKHPLQIQGVFLTGTSPKSSKYKKVNLG